MTGGLKFRIQVEEKLYYQYSENKGADQLRGYHEADLRLCFRICKKPVFSGRGSFIFRMSRVARKPVFGVSDTRAVQSQKLVRGLTSNIEQNRTESLFRLIG